MKDSVRHYLFGPSHAAAIAYAAGQKFDRLSFVSGVRQLFGAERGSVLVLMSGSDKLPDYSAVLEQARRGQLSIIEQNK